MENQENQQRQDLPLDDSWLDEILENPHKAEELRPDEEAIAAAGLAHPSEADIDLIIQETLNEIQDTSPETPQVSLEDTLVIDAPLVSEPAPVHEEAPVSDPLPFSDQEYRDSYDDNIELEGIFDDEAPAEKKRFPRRSARRSQSSDKLEDFPVMDEEQPAEPVARKKRPRRKPKDNLFGLSHLLATCVWLAIIVFIGVTLANVLWVCASDVLAFGRESHETSITIEDTDTIEDISRKLHEVGLIRYPNLFSVYAQFTGAREDISSGTYTLNTIYDYHALVNFMNADSAEREIVEVVIPEGYNCSQIFALLEEEGVCKAVDLELYAATGELDEYWFLEDVTRGSRFCLEGFLFPDTYQFYISDEPRRVLEKMLDAFDYRFTDEMRSALIHLNQQVTEWMEDEGYGEEYIAEHQISLRELVTIASLIEEETANTLESYTISSVIYNRLYRWGDTPSFLNIDAAIIYALGEHKDELTYEDLQVDSPYNTYTHTGLTPGPISNPGLHSLNAALEPDDTDYYYYAMDPDTGAHHFSESEYEHNEFLDSLEDD